jgi:hypothetical protein
VQAATSRAGKSFMLSPRAVVVMQCADGRGAETYRKLKINDYLISSGYHLALHFLP